MKDDILGWVALNLVPELGPARLQQIRERFSNPLLLFGQEGQEVLPELNLPLAVVKALQQFNLKEAEKEIQEAEKHGFQIIGWSDSAYPLLLKNIPDPPVVLYLWGAFSEVDRQAIAVVGTRLCSPYGRLQAERFAQELAAAGLTVVSGLARGIDTASHQGALRAKGRTLAVLGSGLLDLYPPENRRLAEKIAASGAVVSEFPLRMRPDRYTFPRRNRIISGFSLGVLVVEAGLHSGASITAGLALEQGREVFALPGPVDQETSAGTNNLIKEGAHPVTEPAEIIAFLQPHLFFSFSEEPAAITSTEESAVSTVPQKLKAILGQGQLVRLEEIAVALGLSVTETNVLLARLEISGVVQRLPGQRYRLAPP